MLLAKVIGTVVATRKNENLVGSKFLIVETLEIFQRVVAAAVVLWLWIRPAPASVSWSWWPWAARHVRSLPQKIPPSMPPSSASWTIRTRSISDNRCGIWT